MLSRAEKTLYRGELFRHLDGIATAPAAFALKEKGVFDYILTKDSFPLSEITEKF